ncbi:GNAT family N-acetyltransferase [Rhizobiaceae bacterium BDR2-2]|uniref:GNAT family N-acetyltransferase n=1 Tax=Ectorhizobium quercum TaxID=2965071 RepID=A0AAE3N463_9HYPH|nr:GNAT family N-acetyltransferase [Ectorhizobium quercum]MCX8999657.1 GNAT family N-acetyltransferase [Ectorhizobium quercum]
MTEIAIIQSSPLAPEAEPLLEGLILEYDGRYGAASRPGGARAEIGRYPAHAFSPPLGNFLLIRRGGETVAGGAFMSHDDETVEIKRIWTRDDQRRQGLARKVMQALEENAAALGYTRAYLTTGFRQPEAVGLYIAIGYRPLFDVTADPAFYRSLPFEKYIGARAGETGSTPVLPPAASFDEATARTSAIKAAQAEKIAARLALHRAAE